MNSPEPNLSLTYRGYEGTICRLEQCSLGVDRAGRYWLWSEQLKLNLAYKIGSREDCLLAAIDSLLFSIKLRDERIATLQKVYDLANKFASEAFPRNEEDW